MILVLLDYISISFIRLVSLIAGCVLVFRNSYIKDEPYNNRFIILVILFVLSIFILIVRPNIIRLLRLKVTTLSRGNKFKPNFIGEVNHF